MITMEVLTMTALTSDRQRRLVNEGYRLHMAIVEWGRKHGVWAYRVLTATDQWFEVWDPKTKTLSRNFPEKIRGAIESNTDALKAYADDTRMRDARVAAERSRPLAPARGRFWETTDKETPTSGKVSEHH